MIAGYIILTYQINNQNGPDTIICVAFEKFMSYNQKNVYWIFLLYFVIHLLQSGQPESAY